MKLSSDTVLFEQRVARRQFVIACIEMVSQEAYPSRNLVIAWKMRNAFSYIVIFLPRKKKGGKKVSASMQMAPVSCGWGFAQEVNKHNTALICCLIKEGLKTDLDPIPKRVFSVVDLIIVIVHKQELKHNGCYTSVCVPQWTFLSSTHWIFRAANN